MTSLSNRTASRVLHHVCDRTGLTFEALRGRQRRHAPHRRRAARLLHRLGYSSTDIGYALNRHHTTVLHHLGRLGAQR